MMDFVHLHCHTDYSLLDGACRIGKLLDRAEKLGMRSLAITDHGNLFGAIEFYEEAKKRGILPIIGYEAYVAPGSRLNRDTKGVREAAYHLTLLARNETGYRNLLKLSTSAYLEGFYYKPRIDKEILAEHSDGLLALSGCLKSEICQLLLSDLPDDAAQVAGEYADILGRENFYLEIQYHRIEEQRKVCAGLIKLSNELDIPLVATNDTHYLEAADARAHDALICINTGKLLADENRMRMSTNEFYLKTADEMRAALPDCPEAVTRSLEVAKRCHLELSFDQKHLPGFSTSDGKDNRVFLRELCEKGVKERMGSISPESRERLEHELEIIEKTGFVNYLLIVWDLIRFAKESNIPVGPGRGSAVGSLVCYALYIADIDPIKYGLIFERFLTPDRISDPDIDIDFCVNGREKVINYVRDKYGHDNVAQIITFGTMAARGVIRDVGRVLNIPLPQVDMIAKKIPQVPGIKLKDAIEQEPELSRLSQADPSVKELLDISLRLEGMCRHASTHAAGVVIGDRSLTEYTPLYKSGDEITTQYQNSPKKPILEKIGLLKMDFLGLRTLTVIDHTLDLIKETQGLAEKISSLDIPLDEPKTFELLSRGATKGVFQFESAGFRELLQRVKPQKFEDIIPFVALYRPGPLGSGMVDSFVHRRNGDEKIEYIHPSLESILKETYGIVLYQEQVMRVANVMAGFSMSEADTLRAAMAKKKKELLPALRKKFIAGSLANKIDKSIAERTFELIEYFGGYGFNKSHSAAYAMIAYQTAYLKANYPTEFMAALMTSEMQNTDKIVGLINECKQMGLEVLPPDINESEADFNVVNGKIRFGLAAVKNVGQRAIESVVEIRNQHGKFSNLFDFCENIDLQAVNKQVVESLIKSGAFDSTEAKRSQLAAVLERALQIGAQAQQDRKRGQMTLFGTFEAQEGFRQDFEQLPNISEWLENELLAREKEVLGFYVTSHPLAKYENILQRFSTTTTTGLKDKQEGQEVTIGGMIASIRIQTSKNGRYKGEQFAIITLEDLEGTREVVAYTQQYKKYANVIVRDRSVFVKGRASFRRDVPSIIISEIIPIERARQVLTASVSIRLNCSGLNEELLAKLRETVARHNGECPVFLDFNASDNSKALVKVGRPFFVSPNDDLAKDIDALLGIGHIQFNPHQESLSPTNTNEWAATAARN